MFNLAKQKLRRDVNGVYIYTVGAEQALFVLRESVSHLWIYRGQNVFNEQRNRILEQNSEEGRCWEGEEQEL